MNQKELNNYKKNGYIILKNFFPKKKIERTRLEIVKLSKKKKIIIFISRHWVKAKSKFLEELRGSVRILN